MYTMDSVARKINSMGEPAFIEMISSPHFSKKMAEILEELKILVNGIPARELIHQFVASSIKSPLANVSWDFPFFHFFPNWIFISLLIFPLITFKVTSSSGFFV